MQAWLIIQKSVYVILHFNSLKKKKSENYDQLIHKIILQNSSYIHDFLQNQKKETELPQLDKEHL